VAEIDLHRIAPELKQPVTRADFDQSIRKLVGKTVSTVQAMLKTAGVAAEAVDTILFAGGSSGASRATCWAGSVLAWRAMRRASLADGLKG
jgi:molecular chaperone DnaK (HSP70)